MDGYVTGSYANLLPATLAGRHSSHDSVAVPLQGEVIRDSYDVCDPQSGSDTCQLSYYVCQLASIWVSRPTLACLPAPQQLGLYLAMDQIAVRPLTSA